MLSALLLLACTALGAQSFEEYISEVPLRASNGMYHYEPCLEAQTPAPEGYRPFYISHFSRHGSRYPGNSSEKYIQKALHELDSLASCRALSDNGLAVVDACHRFYEECDGNWETLTPRGAAEHRGIATRMAERFPEVFVTDSVDVYSTCSKRVLLSRDNFLLGLPALRTNICTEDQSADFQQEVKGYRIPDNLEKGEKAKTFPKEMMRYRDNDLMAEIFFAEEVHPSKKDLHIIRKGLHCLDNCPVLEDYSQYQAAMELFPLGEFIYNAAASANGRLVQMGLALDNDNVRQEYRGVGIARMVVEDADRAIAERNLAATLRFSHDYFVLPLACVLGIEGADVDCPACEAYRQFESIRFSGMASNMQMVFYSNGKSDVLVKILWSEKEAVVKGLEPVEGVYYRWSDLRKHILGRCDSMVPQPVKKKKRLNNRYA